MSAGNMRFQLEFFQREHISDGYGNERGDYPEEPEFVVSAQAIPRLGGETVIAARLAGSQPITFRVRQSRSTKEVNVEDWRIRDKRSGAEYNIRSIVDPFSGTRDHSKWFDILTQSGVVT